MVLGEQTLLVILPREHEEDERRTEQHRDDPGRVRPLVARQERRLRGRGDLVRVLRVLLRDGLGARERLGQLRLDAVVTFCASGEAAIAAVNAAA